MAMVLSRGSTTSTVTGACSGQGEIHMSDSISCSTLTANNTTGATAVSGSSPKGVGVFASGKTAVSATGPSQFTGNVTVSGTITAANLTVTKNAQFIANTAGGTAVCGSSPTGVGVFASGKTAVSASGPSQFSGNVSVSGTITATAKNCLVDHPSDPENRTLTHACVESDERFNVYSGNIALDENGEARVTLPNWLAAFNRDFRYQLTCIGQSAPVYVAQEIRDDAFSIAGGTAGMKVSWQLTGVRNDAWAQANPLVVEQDKPEDEKGFFLSPEAFGHDHTRHVAYKRHEHLIEAYPRQAEHAIAAYVAGRKAP
jgi:lipopolysaccharide export system protein LptA